LKSEAKIDYYIMGLLNKIFGGTSEVKEKKELPWIPLSELTQLDVIKDKSSTKIQVVFKHSTRCGISSMVMRQFVEAYELTEDDLDLYYLDLLNYREISNEVGYKFQVMHQSPQLIVIKDGVVVAHASHGQINEVDLGSFI
jgi:bacillithiol system protein YtxJ